MSKAQIKSSKPPTTREAILAAATELFSTNGFAGTSMSDLAEELGLSKAAIYHHFESKESILRDLVKSTQEDLENLVKHFESLAPDKVNQTEILQSFAEFVFIHRKVVRLVLSEMPAEMKIHNPNHHRLMQRLQKLLAGKKPNAEGEMRARVAIGIIFTGLVPPPYEKLLNKKKMTLDLLVSIASDALRITQKS